MTTPPSEFRAYQQEFVRYLVDNGYPEDTVVVEFGIGRVARRLIDVAIIDPSRKTPIAVFGLAKEFDELKVKYDHLQGMRRLLHDAPIFLVLRDPETKHFKIFRTFPRHSADHPLVGRGLEEVDLFQTEEQEGVPSYQNMLLRARSASLLEAEKTRQEAVDHFARICWLLAGLVLVAFIADVAGFTSLATSQLSLLALSVALILIPFASKLKILGIEFERQKENSKTGDGQQTTQPYDGSASAPPPPVS